MSEANEKPCGSAATSRCSGAKDTTVGKSLDVHGTEAPEMTIDRFNRIMWYETEDLTEQDVKAGWHFCHEMDGLLLNANEVGNEFCHCLESVKTQHEAHNGRKFREMHQAIQLAIVCLAGGFKVETADELAEKHPAAAGALRVLLPFADPKTMAAIKR